MLTGNRTTIFLMLSFLAAASLRAQSGPAHVAALFDSEQTALRSAISLTVAGNYLYVASFAEDGIQIIDITDPSEPVPVAAFYDNAATALDGARWIEVQGSYAYVA
ncbi:MAG: hypothetical protein OEV30_08085, partial [Ignavibacteria bacterium]|nr:hypothetical protein [Ignavibacteria bacterium]